MNNFPHEIQFTYSELSTILPVILEFEFPEENLNSLKLLFVEEGIDDQSAGTVRSVTGGFWGEIDKKREETEETVSQNFFKVFLSPNATAFPAFLNHILQQGIIWQRVNDINNNILINFPNFIPFFTLFGIRPEQLFGGQVPIPHVVTRVIPFNHNGPHSRSTEIAPGIFLNVLVPDVNEDPFVDRVPYVVAKASSPVSPHDENDWFWDFEPNDLRILMFAYKLFRILHALHTADVPIPGNEVRYGIVHSNLSLQGISKVVRNNNQDDYEIKIHAWDYCRVANCPFPPVSPDMQPSRLPPLPNCYSPHLDNWAAAHMILSLCENRTQEELNEIVMDEENFDVDVDYNHLFEIVNNTQSALLRPLLQNILTDNLQPWTSGQALDYLTQQVQMVMQIEPAMAQLNV